MGDCSASYATTCREAVYEAFADRSRDPEAAIHDALAAGADRLDVGIGFYTRIEDGTQTIKVALGDNPRISPGQTCPLEEAYCRRTVELDEPLSVQNAATSEVIAGAATERFELGTYIGCPISVEGETWGTICFAEETPREQPFTEADELFVELIARLAGEAIERRRYEHKLQERTERLEEEREWFRGIAETSFDILFRIRPDKTISYVSGAIDRALGYDPEAVIDEPFPALLDPDAVEQAASIHDRLTDGETVELYALAFRDADGERVILEINAQPMTANGEVICIQGVARDVTERRARQQQLRVRTRAMDEAAVGITIIDPDRAEDAVVYVNEGFERLTGYEAAAIDDEQFRFLYGPATDRETVERIGTSIDDGESITVEMVNYDRDGRPFWNRVTITPVTDDCGTVTHVLGFHDDVTDRKRMEQLFQRLNRILRHNLRNDMNVLLGYASRLRGGDTSDDLADGLETSVEELLSLADGARRLEHVARKPWEPIAIDPARALADAVETFDEQFPEATITCVVETDRLICAGAELRLAIEELLENAVVHDPSSGTRVAIEAGDDGEFVELTVADDGPGVPETEVEVIRTGEENQLVHGRGLGLWLVNWIVTRYGGSFQIRTGDGDPSGTVATLCLPAIENGENVADAQKRPTTLFW